MNNLLAVLNGGSMEGAALASELSEFAGIDNPATWTPEALIKAIRDAKERRRADTVNRGVDIARIDYAGERDTFLADTRSPHTRRAYAAAMDRLDAWARREDVNPLHMDAGRADRFIRDLKAEGRAAASVRRDIAAVSAFFTFLERYHGAIKNPIRGTKIRPAKENKKPTVIPSAKDYAALLSELPPFEKAVVVVMATRGLRAGALPELERKGDMYTGTSKGKALKEGGTDGITLPAKALAAIKAAGLDARKPFDGMTANALERRINYRVGKLHRAGKIAAPYSCHDFRHFFACNEYKRTKDIVRVSGLLNHGNVAITQTYLKSLGVKL
ncbi:MAG: site-specific integrase [Treponema sp.]|nr:site-specific integrase [Treponema sp.]